MIDITHELSVPFFDIDSMGIVWHGHYLKYFELARCVLLDAIDYNYETMKASGYAWPVVDTRVKYIRPLTFQQIIQIEATLTEYETRLKIDYRIRDKQSGQLHTKGHSIQLAVDMQTRQTCFVTPEIFREKVRSFL